MRILYLLPAISHPGMRGELRHHYFLENLAEKHAVTLVALTRLPPTDEVLSDLRQRTARLEIVHAMPDRPRAGANDRSTDGLAAWRRRYAKQRRWHRSVREMRKTVEQLVRADRFDLAIAYGSELVDALPGVGRLPLVADICDAASVRLRHGLRFGSPVEWPWRVMRWRQTVRAERRMLRRTRHVVFISERDRAAVEGQRRTAAVIPNGVDFEYWRPRDQRVEPDCLVFTGTLDYPPNADAATYLLRQIVPAIKSRVPTATLVIAGRNPTTAVRRLAGESGAVVTGQVADLRPFLARAAVFVAPLRFASGLQNKILEAMAMGVPVVTTTVAAEGLVVDGAPGPPVAVGDRPEEFAAQVAALLRDPGRRQRAATDGRSFVERHFAWKPNADRLERICLEAAREGRTAPV